MSQDERAALLEQKEKEVSEQNATRTGKGTRLRAGQTRGKNPQVITWEAFDVAKLDTLPTTFAEFTDLTKITDEKVIVELLIDGYNDSQYTAASDPIAEYVNPSWPDDVQKQFRIVVRNYANATGVSLDDAVNIIKPGIEKAVAAKS